MFTELLRGAARAAHALPFAFSAGCLAAAGSAGAADEKLFLADLPLVLTPSRLPQPLNEAPAAVTVIDRDLIQATGYRDIPRLLRLVPGMQVGQERGDSHWVTYHGMGNDFPSWMQVLIDGRSVYSPGSFNGVDWAALPIAIDEIERIEVVRGTNSAAYGANAFLGVINIITRDSADNPGLRLAGTAGNAGIQGGSLSWSQSLAGGGGLRLNAEARQDDGFDRLHDSQRFNVVSLRGDKSLDDRNELMFRLAASEGRRQLGYPDSIYGNNAERSADSFNGTFHVQWRHLPSADEELLVHFYRNHDRTTEAWLATAPPPFSFKVPLDRNRNAVRDNVEVQHRWSPGPGWRVVWGLEARHDRVESPFLYFGAARQQSSLARLFGQAEWRLRPGWLVNASALVERTDDNAPRFSPRLFANWQADADHALRAGYARAWREPTLFERNGDVRAMAFGLLLVRPYLPNPDLLASRMDSLELGYVARAPAWHTQFDLRLFHERIDNYIYRVSHPEYTVPLLSRTLPSARYENLGEPVTLSGLEYQVDSRPFPGTRLLFSHALVRRQAPTAALAQLTAPYTASLTWIQDWPAAWSTTLSVLRMGPLAGGTGFVPSLQYVSRPYTTVDARLARRFDLGNMPATVALVATNLGGRHQEIADRAEQAMHGSEPVNPTSPQVWLTLSLQPR